MANRKFQLKQETSYSLFKMIPRGVPQWSVLVPVLYLLETCDIPQGNDNIEAIFTDKTASAHKQLQINLNQVSKFTNTWHIHSIQWEHVVPTNIPGKSKALLLNGEIFPRVKPVVWNWPRQQIQETILVNWPSLGSKLWKQVVVVLSSVEEGIKVHVTHVVLH